MAGDKLFSDSDPATQTQYVTVPRGTQTQTTVPRHITTGGIVGPDGHVQAYPDVVRRTISSGSDGSLKVEAIETVDGASIKNQAKPVPQAAPEEPPAPLKGRRGKSSAAERLDRLESLIERLAAPAQNTRTSPASQPAAHPRAPQSQPVYVSFTGEFGTLKASYKAVVLGEGCLILASDPEVGHSFIPPASDAERTRELLATWGGQTVYCFNFGMEAIIPEIGMLLILPIKPAGN